MSDKRDCTICNIRMNQVCEIKEDWKSGRNCHLFQCPKCKTIIKLLETWDSSINDYIWKED